MKRKILILALMACMLILLSSCGPKKCTSKICIEGDCTEIEVECEDSSQIDNEPVDEPDNSQDIAEPPQNTDNQNTPDNTDNTNTPISTPVPTPATPKMLNLPTLVEDPGLDYDSMNPNEQAAMNAFQAIVDGDYQGLLNMFYLEDNRFVDIDDMKIFFQISNYVSLKGKNVTPISAKANGTGMEVSVNIQYYIGEAPGPDDSTGYKEWEIKLTFKDDQWKYVDDGFIGKDFKITANKGDIVKLDGIQLEGQETYNYMAYLVPTMSKVEHTLEITRNGETTTHLIVPGRDALAFQT